MSKKNPQAVPGLWKTELLTIQNASGYGYRMQAYTAEALVILARAYIRATRAPATRLGLQSVGNQHLFERLLDGYDCLTRSALRASDWFDQNWPEGLPWPREVPPRGIAAVSARRTKDVINAVRKPSAPSGKRAVKGE